MRNAKSNRLLVISRLVGSLGVFACMLAAVIYMMLTVSGNAGEYNPVNIYIIAALAVVFVVIAVILRVMSNRAAKEAEDELDISEVVEDAVEEVLETCADAVDSICDTVDETVEDVEETVVEAASQGMLQLTPEKKEKIVKAVKKNAPVVLAVAATAALSIALHNSAKQRQQAKVRKSILDLLY
jgi:NADH:ubiquinone oxidoreductase subunit 6 (subunit J)